MMIKYLKQSTQAAKGSKGALSLFEKAINKLKKSNQMAKAVQVKNREKTLKLELETTAMDHLAKQNVIVIDNIEKLLGKTPITKDLTKDGQEISKSMPEEPAEKN